MMAEAAAATRTVVATAETVVISPPKLWMIGVSISDARRRANRVFPYDCQLSLPRGPGICVDEPPRARADRGMWQSRSVDRTGQMTGEDRQPSLYTANYPRLCKTLVTVPRP